MTGMVNHVFPCLLGTRKTVAFCLKSSIDCADKKCRSNACVRYSVTRLAMVGFFVVAKKNRTCANRFLWKGSIKTLFFLPGVASPCPSTIHFSKSCRKFTI